MDRLKFNVFKFKFIARVDNKPAPAGPESGFKTRNHLVSSHWPFCNICNFYYSTAADPGFPREGPPTPEGEER